MHSSSGHKLNYLEGYRDYAVGTGNSHMRFYDVTSWSYVNLDDPCGKGKRSVESLENITEVAEGHAKSLVTHHLLSWQIDYIEAELWRHMTRKIARSPHILWRLNACGNSVYQALLVFRTMDWTTGPDDLYATESYYQ